MPKENNLTQLQIHTLITLWAQPAGEVANADLIKIKLNLDKPGRDKLLKAGLIDVRQDRKSGPVFMQLTKAGRERAQAEAESDAELPSGTKSGEAALHAVLTALRPLLDRSAMTLPDLIARLGGGRLRRVTDVADITDVDMETRIRKAYGEIAPRAGAWVMLNQLREALGHPDRAQVDAALIQLSRAPDVDIVPESNQKVLTQDERTAAVSIGNQDVHLISIGL
jgi:DNA-binding MarR family transcriptional regulator